jgi:hypothetical protein
MSPGRLSPLISFLKKQNLFAHASTSIMPSKRKSLKIQELSNVVSLCTFFRHQRATAKSSCYITSIITADHLRIAQKQRATSIPFEFDLEIEVSISIP